MLHANALVAVALQRSNAPIHKAQPVSATAGVVGAYLHPRATNGTHVAE